jgi:hypothetical protein
MVFPLFACNGQRTLAQNTEVWPKVFCMLTVQYLCTLCIIDIGYIITFYTSFASGKSILFYSVFCCIFVIEQLSVVIGDDVLSILDVFTQIHFRSSRRNVSECRQHTRTHAHTHTYTNTSHTHRVYCVPLIQLEFMLKQIVLLYRVSCTVQRGSSSLL